MPRTSKHATGNKNRVSENKLSNIFQILRKPTPSYHIVRSGRVEQLALPCTRIPLAPVPLGALRDILAAPRRGLQRVPERFAARRARFAALQGRFEALLDALPESFAALQERFETFPDSSLS